VHSLAHANFQNGHGYPIYLSCSVWCIYLTIMIDMETSYAYRWISFGNSLTWFVSTLIGYQDVFKKKWQQYITGTWYPQLNCFLHISNTIHHLPLNRVTRHKRWVLRKTNNYIPIYIYVVQLTIWTGLWPTPDTFRGSHVFPYVREDAYVPSAKVVHNVSYSLKKLM
jgi:hypothetical protein